MRTDTLCKENWDIVYLVGYRGVREERETTGEEVGVLLASVERGWGVGGV